MEPVPPSVSAISGVDSRFTVASSVILFIGPAVSIFLSSPLLSEPVLQLLVFAGALFGLFSLLIPGVIALGIVDGSSEVTVNNMQALFDNRALLVVIDCILHDLMRLWLVYLIVKGERFFRRNGQVMYHSNIRLLPLGASAGFGFGFLRGLCVVASSASVSMNVESTTSNAGFVRNSPVSLGVYSNLGSCVAMPLLVQQSASHLMAFFGDIIWTLLFTPFVAGIMLKQENTSMVNNRDDDGDESQTTHIRRSQSEKDPRWYEPTTTTSSQQVLFLVIGFATHLIFGLISLVNTDAISFGSSANNALSLNKERGCAVALSVQAVMVVLAGIAACYLTVKIEKFPSHLIKWVRQQNTSNNNILASSSSSTTTTNVTTQVVVAPPVSSTIATNAMPQQQRASLTAATGNNNRNDDDEADDDLSNGSSQPPMNTNDL